MLVPLIPLILAAKINESDWKYGPEVIYDVKVLSMSQSVEIEPHMITTLIWISKMACREKSQLILSCTIYPLEIEKGPFREWGNSPAGPFELHFGHRGLEKLVCSSTVEPSVLDTFRAVADQLNLGADLSTIPRDIFDVMENSTTGECKTGFELLSTDIEHDEVDGSTSSSEESDEDNTNVCEIVIVPGMQTPSGEMKEIKKIRHLNECRRQYRHVFAIMQNTSPYFVGSPTGTPVEGLVGSEFLTESIEFVSSESHMIIKDDSFTSYTKKIFITNHKEHPAPTRLSEAIEVKLNKIEAAKGPLQSVKHPSAVSIFPERWIRRDGANV